MKRLLVLLTVIFFSVPVALWAMQSVPGARAEITGVNSSNLPEVVITANVFDPVSQPILGLTAENFELVGELADRARIVDVQNISDDNLPFSVLLVIDVSSSMTGLPIERAIEAAQLFVDSIGPNDSVAVYTFSGTFNLRQPYTTDKDVLHAAIESITVGGPTGLYQGAYNSIALAASAPDSRRAVILLSDGAEYGAVSSVGRGAALQEAQLAGVPVYTIGLGYGIDRTYLRELSEGTNTRFYESPTPEELADIYADLAALLTSQYIITLNVDVPADGTEYDLALDVTTPFGIAGDNATVRAPIPVPIVRAPVFSGPLVQPTEVTPQFAADDAIDHVDYSIDGAELSGLPEAPYSFTIDPETLSPGTHQLLLSVTDITGDTGTAQTTFEVGALPPRVNVVSNLDQTVANVQTVQVEIGGQTAGTGATFQIDEGRVVTDDEAPFAFDIDPMVLPPGAHTLTIVASNQGDQSSTVEVPFTVANLAPYVVVSGIEEGATVDETITVEVNVIQTQTPVTDVEILVNGQPLDNREIPPDAIVMSTASLDPMAFAPGPATLTVRATNSSGGVSETEINFTIEQLTPVVVFENLAQAGELTEDLEANIEFLSQTPIERVEFELDGEPLPPQTSPPWNIPIDVLALGPGVHTLTVTATNASGETASSTVEFVVSEAPGLTATALVPTPTPTATADVPATLTLVAQVTANAQSTLAANTQIAEEATATERSLAATGTAESRSTGTAVAAAQIAAQAAASTATQAVVQATRTEVAAVTIQARALAQAATSTAVAGQQATEAAGHATATGVVQATATQRAQQQQASATAVSQERATATSVAQSTATGQANQQATATSEALQQRATATAQSAATIAAQAQQQASATSEARQLATSTAESAATSAAEAVLSTATQVAIVRATEAADEATATSAAQATATAQAQQQASATVEAAERATSTADARQQATATQNARLLATQTAAAAELATATREAIVVALAATSTSEFRATATQDARLQQTQTAEAEEATRNAQATATQAAQNRALTQTAVAQQATENAQATATQDARNQSLTQTAVAQQQATATQNARNNAETQTAVAQQATEAAQATATQNARNQSLTQTAVARQATQAAQATATQEARNDALTQTAVAEQATENAQSTATQAAEDRALTQTAVAQATETRQTEDDEATRVAQLAATATQDAAERAEALTATAASRQTATAEAIGLTATSNARVTATARTQLNVQATADAGSTESADATQAAATVSAATAAAAEAATRDAQATRDARETATASATEEATEVAQLPTDAPTEEPTIPATPTPRGTLVPVEAESQAADVNQLVPILVVIVAAIVVLIVIYLILRGGRRR